MRKVKKRNGKGIQYGGTAELEMLVDFSKMIKMHFLIIKVYLFFFLNVFKEREGETKRQMEPVQVQEPRVVSVMGQS